MSSSRPYIKPFPVIVNGDMSGSVTSEPTILTNLSMVSYQISWVGTSPIGEIILEGSDNYSENAAGGVANAGTWVELPLSASANVSGNSDTGVIDVTATSVHAVRIRYVRGSGTGVMNALVSAKVA